MNIFKKHRLAVCPHPSCSQIPMAQSRLKYHFLRFHHDRSEKGHKCEWCSKYFWMPHELRRHVNEVRRVSTWQCTEPGCGQSFKRERNLKQHANTHLAIKPYQCLWCDFTGVQHNNIRSHASTAHRAEFSSVQQAGKRYWRPTNSEPSVSNIPTSSDEITPHPPSPPDHGLLNQS